MPVESAPSSGVPRLNPDGTLLALEKRVTARKAVQLIRIGVFVNTPLSKTDPGRPDASGVLLIKVIVFDGNILVAPPSISGSSIPSSISIPCQGLGPHPTYFYNTMWCHQN